MTYTWNRICLTKNETCLSHGWMTVTIVPFNVSTIVIANVTHFSAYQIRIRRSCWIRQYMMSAMLPRASVCVCLPRGPTDDDDSVWLLWDKRRCGSCDRLGWHFRHRRRGRHGYRTADAAADMSPNISSIVSNSQRTYTVPYESVLTNHCN